MNTENKTQPRVYFEHLDLLRAIAAIMVLVAHTFEQAVGQFGYPDLMVIGQTQNLTFFGKYLDNILSNGGFGVDVFFLISGFLITYLLLVEKERNEKINLVNFYIRRTLRIWPLYFLLIILAPILVSWLGTEATPPYLMTSLFLNNFYTIQTELWIFPFAHYWSICVEEHFYLLWPFLIAFISNKNLPFVFISFIFISIVSRGIFAALDLGYYYQYLHTLSRIDVLAFGALGAFYYHKKPFKVNYSMSLRIFVYALFILVYGYERYNMYDGVFLSCFRKYFYNGVIAFAMVNFLFHEKPLIRLPRKTWFHYLGKISYGIYMYSAILLIIINRKIIPFLDSKGIIINLAINLLLSILIAAISYETIEKYFLRLKSRFEIIRTRK